MRLSGKLPEGDANGIAGLANDLITKPGEMHVVLAIVDTYKLTTDVDANTVIPTLRVRRIEPLLAEDLGTARRLLERAFEQRTGKATLPLELEDELESAFEGVDVDEETDSP